MKVLVDLCIVPIGVGVSLSAYIAECEKVLSAAGLKTSLHSYGTISKVNGMMSLPPSSSVMKKFMRWEHHVLRLSSRWERVLTETSPWKTKSAAYERSFERNIITQICIRAVARLCIGRSLLLQQDSSDCDIAL